MYSMLKNISPVKTIALVIKAITVHGANVFPAQRTTFKSKTRGISFKHLALMVFRVLF